MTTLATLSPEALRDVLGRLPKAELHCHLDGSLRPSTLFELSANAGRPLPVATEHELADWMRVDDAQNLADYLARFEVTLAIMQDVAALERIAHELVEDAALDGVRYIEVRFCPGLNTRGGLALDTVVAAVLRGLDSGEEQTGTVARLIICALRTLPVAHAFDMAELAVEFRHRGVVAFDLAGGEAGNPAHAFSAAFTLARVNDLAVTVHAGEGDGAGSIRDAVHRCGAHRIGHGTRLWEDPSLEAYMIDRQIPLEVCPTSNVQTRVVRTFAEHPLARYVRMGAVVTISTDNRLMSGVSLTDEYVHCATQLGLDVPTLGRLSLNAFQAAFLPFAERGALAAQAERDMAELFETAFESANR